MPLEDKRVRRMVEHEVAKHPIDPSLLNITVINQVATFKGRVSPLRGALGRGVDIKSEMKKIEDACLTIKGVSSVVIDVSVDQR